MKDKEKQIEEAAETHWRMQYIMALDESTKPYIIEDFKAGVNWQSKMMYSEDDLREAFQVGFNVGYNDESSPSYLSFDEWLKQYNNRTL